MVGADGRQGVQEMVGVDRLPFIGEKHLVYPLQCGMLSLVTPSL
jgi:hypothetical protein